MRHTEGGTRIRQQRIYEHAADGSARFVLGTVCTHPLVRFGINPSTAAPNAPDRTVAERGTLAR